MNDETRSSSIDQRTAQRVADIQRAAGTGAKVTVDRRENVTRISVTYKDAPFFFIVADAS